MSKRSILPVSLYLGLCLVAGTLSAGGVPEENRLREGRLKAYLLLPEREINEIFLDQFYLAPYLSAFVWSAFRSDGQDIAIETSGGYRIAQKRATFEEPVGGLILREYEVETDHHAGNQSGSRAAKAQRTDTVTFRVSDLVSKEGRLSNQPAAYALLSAIRKNGATSGWVRLRSLTYRKRGRFEAKVEISR
jgi:hypothetical protein